MARNIYNLTPPVVSYVITVNNVDYTINNEIKVSFVSGFNKVYIKLTPNVLLNRFIVNSTFGNDAYDIDIGTRLISEPGTLVQNIPANQETTVFFDVTNLLFDRGEGIYRIGLYAQSASDYSWDVTYLLIDINSNQLVDSSAENLEALDTRIVS